MRSRLEHKFASLEVPGADISLISYSDEAKPPEALSSRSEGYQHLPHSLSRGLTQFWAVVSSPKEEGTDLQRKLPKQLDCAGR